MQGQYWRKRSNAPQKKKKKKRQIIPCISMVPECDSRKVRVERWVRARIGSERATRKQKTRNKINKNRKSAQKKCVHVQLYSHGVPTRRLNWLHYFSSSLLSIQRIPSKTPQNHDNRELNHTAALMTYSICRIAVNMNFDIASNAIRVWVLPVETYDRVWLVYDQCMIMHDKCMTGAVETLYDRCMIGVWCASRLYDHTHHTDHKLRNLLMSSIAGRHN